MRIVKIDDIKTGMQLSRAIYSSDGRMLLSEGMPLKESYINKLKGMGVYAVYVEDDMSKDINIRDVIHEQTRLQARLMIKKAMDNIAVNRNFEVSRISNIVNKIVDELILNRNILVNLEDIRSLDGYTFSHSVNVCVLSIITGINLGYNDMRLKELGVGALLHDIGKSRIPRDIINKPDALSTDEFEEIKKHTVYGHDILKEYNEIGYTSRFIALAHHERHDGTGYPLGIKGKDLHEFARIVAIADVYDALTSDRVYKKRISRDKAIEYVLSMSGQHFDGDIVNVFMKNIPIYPVGTIVLLSTKQKGIVMKVNRSYPTRPLVRVITDSDGNEYSEYKEVDLMKEKDILVLQILQ